MNANVTAATIAGDLEVKTSRLTRWLRKQREAGNPLLADRPPGSPWIFTREHADQLAAAFSASAGQVSDSEVQRRAEAVIRDRLAERLGVVLDPRIVTLDAGAPVHVDAVSPDGRFM